MLLVKMAHIFSLNKVDHLFTNVYRLVGNSFQMPGYQNLHTELTKSLVPFSTPCRSSSLSNN